MSKAREGYQLSTLYMISFEFPIFHKVVNVVGREPVSVIGALIALMFIPTSLLVIGLHISGSFFISTDHELLDSFSH